MQTGLGLTAFCCAPFESTCDSAAHTCALESTWPHLAALMTDTGALLAPTARSLSAVFYTGVVDNAHQRALGAYGAIPARMGRSMGVRFSTGLVANIDWTTTCRTWPHIWRTWLALLA